MTRPTLAAVTFIAMLGSTNLHAASFEQTEARAVRGLGTNVCVNCSARDETHNLHASRIERTQRIASKLTATNACADPGAAAWFVEEEAHLTAFINSQSAPRYK